MFCLVNKGFQQPLYLLYSHKLVNCTSLAGTIENNLGKASSRESLLYHLSFQNFTLLLFPTLYPILLRNSSHLLLIAFHNSTPYPFLRCSRAPSVLFLPTLPYNDLLPKGLFLVAISNTIFQERPCLE